MKTRKPPKRNQPETGNHLQPQFAGCFGATGSGKSHAMWKKHIEWQAENRRQVLVWSPKEPKDNYAGQLRCKAYRNMGELVKAARQGKNVVFVPTLHRDTDEKQFDLFCRLAMALAPCVLIVDELHTVTRANGGTPAWNNVCLTGRASGVRVLASSQRPAHVDKSFYGGLTFAWCGRQSFRDDAKTAAELVLATPQQILTLPNRQGITRVMS